MIAVYFLLAHDWQAMPADLASSTTWGWLDGSAPQAGPVPAANPNIAGGLMALFLPFNVTLLVAARKTRQPLMAA